MNDFLTWWREYDSRVQFTFLDERDFNSCNLSSFPNLHVYINPGGDAYSQLGALGVSGTTNIKEFVLRNQTNRSSYVGFCAGGYLASHDYIWETVYEGTDFYDYSSNPPLSLFPHTLEGSIFDINDDQYGDQSGSKFRVVNVSNGHRMLYYGGSTFGYNGVPAYADPVSLEFDENIEVLIYYTDFYGYFSANIPAAWKYRNLVLSSVHPEADGCTYEQDSDCPPAGTLPTEVYLQNWAWLCTYINDVAGTNFVVPSVPVKPLFDTSPPHSTYQRSSCYDENFNFTKHILFCDNFDSVLGVIPWGLSAQFQRNNSDFNFARPWNTTYITSWNGEQYASPHSGDGYAVAVTMSSVSHYSTFRTRPIALSDCTSRNITLQYGVIGKTLSNGYITVDISVNSFKTRVVLFSQPLYPALENWKVMSHIFELPAGADTFQIRFSCAAGSSPDNYCAVDTTFAFCNL